MKNYILTFLLAVLVVLASVMVRNTLANGNTVASEGAAVMAIGPGPAPFPPRTLAIGPGPAPFPPRTSAIGPGPAPFPPRTSAIGPGPAPFPPRVK
jgi:hypothetical protein